MARKILITGGAGYIGLKTARRILETSDREVLLWIRAKDDADLQQKSATIKASLPNPERVSFFAADLTDASAFTRLPWADITGVIHSAAVTNFNVAEDVANDVNRDGSLRLFEEARKHKLEKLTYVSTVYSSGLRAGEVKEEFYDNSTGFANHYERSKWEVEESIRTRFKDLPWEIARVATVLCENPEGQVTQQNAVHNTLKLFFYGLISLLPGKSSTPVYLVTGDEVAMAIAHLHLRAKPHGIYNVCHEENVSISLGGLLDASFAAFNEDESFKSRRILKPLFTDQDSFDSLVHGVKAFGGQVLTQAVSSIAPFGRQLFIRKDLKNTNLKKNCPEFTDWDAEKTVRNTCRFLAKTRFQKG